MNEIKTVYVATVYRSAEVANHSYVIGAFSTMKKAKIAARKECYERGFKFGYAIDECNIDEELPDKEIKIISPHGDGWEKDKP